MDYYYYYSGGQIWVAAPRLENCLGPRTEDVDFSRSQLARTEDQGRGLFPLATSLPFLGTRPSNIGRPSSQFQPNEMCSLDRRGGETNNIKMSMSKCVSV